jgi:hypothetical protein
MILKHDTRTQELARIAPNVVCLFKRPKVIQASQFMQVVEALVTFAQDPERFFEGFRALTVRVAPLLMAVLPDAYHRIACDGMSVFLVRLTTHTHTHTCA